MNLRLEEDCFYGYAGCPWPLFYACIEVSELCKGRFCWFWPEARVFCDRDWMRSPLVLDVVTFLVEPETFCMSITKLLEPNCCADGFVSWSTSCDRFLLI